MEGFGLQFGLLGLAVFILYLFVFRPRRSLRPSDNEETYRAPVREVRAEIDEIFVRLEEFSRETMAKLDTKVRLLNQLVIDADARIKRLEELERKDPAPGTPAGKPAGMSAGMPAGLSADASAGPGTSAAAPPGVVVPPVPPEQASPAPEPLPVNPLHRRVYALHDKGLTLPEIEAETGLPKGEVELILGMRRLVSRPD